MTKGRDDNYFYDGFEMPVLCGLVDKTDENINKINSKIKSKYNNIDWNIIDSKKDDYNGMQSLKLGEIWNLASGVLEDGLLDGLNKILEIELPVYYRNYCNYQHKRLIEKNK